ncbi:MULTISPECIES: hypothetical protein [Chryseobacterium]|uniref:GLPGLI family protein n=1 Tax=Chryseobacterium geocarposphaerae TaxID=1416776 RepID=A0ABU1LG32_9FLAO|nr:MULTISPECIES: hypothetical protein [Chryseobacterium]ALR30298.1 hypothetical protein ATE47_07055 [Chryseobacterium sp. IHB B 17019]MDR6405545.1 hypothetical protein [Chryseobacterium geocarposphaerae]MDR6698776.1 hypothetical protein [Chryseobacterium ginsenosidimutans]
MIKKIILITGLVGSCIIYAQKFPAVLTFKDGKVVNGFADELAKVSKKNLLDYKESKDAQKKQVSLDDLSKIEYKEGNKTAIAEPIPVAELKNEKKWLYKIYTGKLNVYTFSNGDIENSFRNGNFYSKEAKHSIYIFQYKNEPGNIVTSMMDGGPLTINSFQKKANVKALLKYFKDKCPKVNEAYEKGEIEFKKDPFTFVEYFEKNCN